MAERWLIITGAGASRNLSNDERAPMPLMQDWSKHLVSELANQSPGFPQALRLTAQQTGEEFEERLGDFLNWTRSLAIARRFQGLGSTPLGEESAEITRWFDDSEARARQAVDVIHETLFDLFGQDRISPALARKAYGALFERLSVDPPTGSHGAASLTYATTNYDVAGEVALSELGYLPHWGEDARLTGPALINSDNLLDIPHRIPVLHLHGRVGWYRNLDGVVLSAPPNQRFNAAQGTPALLLPDPNKDYAELQLVQSLWEQFRTAIGQATRVLVLGHSLNDQALVDALRGSIAMQQVGVTVLRPWDATAIPTTQVAIERIQVKMFGAHVLPMDFGPNLAVDDQTIDRFVRADQPDTTLLSRLHELV